MNPMIFIAEDDQFLLDAYTKQLESDGYQIECAKDGEEALMKVKALHPSLVILDLVMPKRSGLQVLEALRQSLDFDDTPVIVATNISSNADKEACEKLKATYIVKTDLSMQDFSDLIRRKINSH